MARRSPLIAGVILGFAQFLLLTVATLGNLLFSERALSGVLSPTSTGPDLSASTVLLLVLGMAFLTGYVVRDAEISIRGFVFGQLVAWSSYLAVFSIIPSAISGALFGDNDVFQWAVLNYLAGLIILIFLIGVVLCIFGSFLGDRPVRKAKAL